MSYLILLRHGESRWNTVNRFTGWVDVPLSERGVEEAMQLAKSIQSLRLDVAFSSHLERAHQTLLTVLSFQHRTGIFTHKGEHNGFQYSYVHGKNEIPIHTDWVLNERHYGVLQGMDKAQAAEIYGKDIVADWRRSFTGRPPQGESLADVYERVVPFLRTVVWPEIRQGKNVLLVAHGNTLRAAIKYFEQIPDSQIPFLEVRATEPFVYTFHNNMLARETGTTQFTRPMLWA